MPDTNRFSRVSDKASEAILARKRKIAHEKVIPFDMEKVDIAAIERRAMHGDEAARQELLNLPDGKQRAIRLFNEQRKGKQDA